MIPVEGAGWSCLPAELLLRIFHSLKEVDFVAASSTCSNWRRVFHESPIWKRRVFDLSKPSTVNLEKIAAFVACTGCHLKDLRIICSDTPVLSPNEVSTFMDTLLSSLSDLNNGQSNMRCFHFEDLEVHNRREQDDVDTLGIIVSLAKFIQDQSNLEELHLKHLNVVAPSDQIIFQSISKSPSLKHLKVLNLVDLCSTYSYKETFKKHGLKGCYSLEELAINYGMLSAVRFDHLWSSLRETLKVLNINITRKDAFACRVGMIDSAWWRLLGNLFPGMRVSITIQDTIFDVSEFLVNGIPLVSFSWKETSVLGATLTAQANKFLDLMVEFYSQTLRSLSLVATGYMVEPVSKERVSNLVRSCPNLSEISFSAPLMNNTLLEEIKAIAVPRTNNVACAIRII